jgi:hypothetical protein
MLDGLRAADEPRVHHALQVRRPPTMASLLNCGRGCREIYGGRYFRAGCATACDTPRRAKRRISRPSDRTRKIAKRLHDKWGDATADVYDLPPKPPRMRCATYKRLEAQYDDLEDRWGLGIIARN